MSSPTVRRPLAFRLALTGLSRGVRSVSEVSRILDRAQQGDPKATDELLPLVYAELRRLAAHKMAGERPGQTLQPTALVHEAWVKIAGDGSEQFANRRHFFKADIIELLARNPDLDLDETRAVCRRYRLNGLEELIREALE